MGRALPRTTTGLAALAILISGCGSTPAAAPPVAAPAPTPAPAAVTDMDMSSAPTTTKAKGPKGCLQAHQESATGSPGCIPKAQICADGALWWRADIDKLCGPPMLARVLIVSLPSAEWPGAEYCLVYSGAGHTPPREAALVADSPAANCAHDFVSARTGKSPGPDESPFYPARQACTTAFPGTRLTYPAVLDYDAPGAKRPRQWACLNG